MGSKGLPISLTNLVLFRQYRQERSSPRSVETLALQALHALTLQALQRGAIWRPVGAHSAPIRRVGRLFLAPRPPPPSEEPPVWRPAHV